MGHGRCVYCTDDHDWKSVAFSSHADDCDWIYLKATVYSTIMIGFIKAVISG